MQDMTPKLPRLWLEEEFVRRRAKNPSYSLRAFARQMQIPPGRLSEILSSKRQITPHLAQKLAERLALDPATREKFLATVRESRAERANTDLLDGQGAAPYQQLSLDAFHAIADWHHFAILSLIELDEFKYDTRWIARRLGLSTVDVRSALERLLRLELVEERRGTLKRTKLNLTTTHDLSSVAVRRRHTQVLTNAIAALEEVPVDERDVTSMTMAIDPARLPQAKEMIRQFRRKLCAFLESGAKKEVYDLNVQLIPLTKKEKQK